MKLNTNPATKKPKIFFLPIEPIEERYSIQWLSWFKEAFNNLNIPESQYEIIDPPGLISNLGIKNKENSVGEVLNIYNTNYYKSAQLCKLTEFFHQSEIKDNDVIFLMDAWNPVIEQLEYIRLISGIKFKICGMLHAGCWDKHDFVNRYNFQDKKLDHCEKSWLLSLDEIYVASDFHKAIIQSFHNDIYTEIEHKIIKVPFPLNIPYASNTEKKENIIVFPHRLDDEKRPHLFIEFAEYFNSRSKYANQFTFIRSKDVCKTKDDFYNLLAKSKVSISFAQQETFGIAMLESVAQGCIPLVPNKLSYKEMYPHCFKYESKDIDRNENENGFYFVLKQLENILDNYNMYQHILPSILAPYSQACANILLYAYNLGAK